MLHEQGDKVHIKLALALLIAALQQKWMPHISERFNYTHNQLQFLAECESDGRKGEGRRGQE